MLHAEGPLCTIDLDRQEYHTEGIDDVLEAYVGGRGVATALAHERIPFDVDPLGSANRLYFATGPLQVSTMSFTGRTNATAVSPLTNGLASSNAGGVVAVPTRTVRPRSGNHSYLSARADSSAPETRWVLSTLMLPRLQTAGAPVTPVRCPPG